MSAPSDRHLWSTPDRTRRFVVPDNAALPPGDFVIRTAAGRERAVDEAALAPYAVTEEEATAWAKEQLGEVFGEMRGQTLGFVERLRAKTEQMREENRATWEQAAADAPDDLKDAAEKLRGMLKDLGQTLQRAAREHGARPAQSGTDASAGAEKPESGPPAPHAAETRETTSPPPDAGSESADPPHPGPS